MKVIAKTSNKQNVDYLRNILYMNFKDTTL